ncbi:MAG: imidazole glycerol phosphate synthase subunit HisH [Candidatus Scalindua sp.]|nr:imidazole glycerol phosphate synthase subunit HisH [Candidatus Scalindua sp.]
MISIIDYGMGNLRSVAKAFEKVGFETVITNSPEIIDKSDKIVLPGVGAFKDACDGLREIHLVDPIRNHVRKGKPFLGICLGLQLLFTRSTEGGEQRGLGIIDGEVVRFQSPQTDYHIGLANDAPFPGGVPGRDGHKLKIPHMGWNGIRIKKKVPLLKGVPDNAYMYFVHSYHVIPDQPEIIAAETEYGALFVSMIAIENIFAMQFHPEKSQSCGLLILQNFAEL